MLNSRPLAGSLPPFGRPTASSGLAPPLGRSLTSSGLGAALRGLDDPAFASVSSHRSFALADQDALLGDEGSGLYSLFSGGTEGRGVADKPLYHCTYDESCPYTTSYRSDMAKHVRTHTGDKPFGCSLCAFTTGDKSNLNQHMKRHTGEKPFPCQHCPYKARRKDSLKRHLLKHAL